MNVEKGKLINNTEKLVELKKKNSNSIFFISVVEFPPTAKRIVFSILLVSIITLFLHFILFKHVMVIPFLAEIIPQLNIILIPIFAVIITGYAIFQGLVNGKTLLLMTAMEHKENTSMFQIYNLYFYSLACKYLFLIIINNLMFLITFLPPEWSFVLFSNKTNAIISSLLISIYLTVIFNLLLNMKNFIYNLFQVFITNATVNVIDNINEEQKNN